MATGGLNKQVTLLSETDSFGTILFVNDAFCEISKYTKEELIGKPHNIIRHPDMPSEFFKTLWASIKRGEIFRGVIKNKAKDGTPYWVSAIIMPVFKNEKEIEKYIGVRHLISSVADGQALLNKQLRSSIS